MERNTHSKGLNGASGLPPTARGGGGRSRYLHRPPPSGRLLEPESETETGGGATGGTLLGYRLFVGQGCVFGRESYGAGLPLVGNSHTWVCWFCC